MRIVELAYLVSRHIALLKAQHRSGVNPTYGQIDDLFEFGAQLEAAATLWHEHPTTYLHTHLSENQAEIDWVLSLFPERSSYTDVYDHYGLVTSRSIFAHGVHLTEVELQRLGVMDFIHPRGRVIDKRVPQLSWKLRPGAWSEANRLDKPLSAGHPVTGR